MLDRADLPRWTPGDGKGTSCRKCGNSSSYISNDLELRFEIEYQHEVRERRASGCVFVMGDVLRITCLRCGYDWLVRPMDDNA